MKPDAIRQRRVQERRRAEIDELERLEAKHGPAPSFVGIPPIPPKGHPVEPDPVPPIVGVQDWQSKQKPASYDNTSAPLHATKKIASGGSPMRFAGPATLPSSSEDVPPASIVPPEPEPQAAPPPPRPTTTIEEAKLFGKAVVGYFKFGTGMLLAKNPDAMAALSQLAAHDPEWGKALSPEGLSTIYAFIGGCAERCAIRYNLRIPYMDEVVVVGAIGIATFGVASKQKAPSDATRVAQAKNANTPAAKPAAKNGVAKPEEPTEQPNTPISVVAEDSEIDLS
jgi:hypothetical protein